MYVMAIYLHANGCATGQVFQGETISDVEDKIKKIIEPSDDEKVWYTSLPVGLRDTPITFSKVCY